MKKIFLSITLLVLSVWLHAQDSPKQAVSKLGANPVFIINNQKVTQAELSNYSEDSIATVIMFYDTSATKLFGDQAKDGAVVIETRSFARQKSIKFLREMSSSYDSLYKIFGSDSVFVYIINDKIQNGNYEGNLSTINKDLYVGIDILSKEQLYSKYGITDKQFGILIHSKKPQNLYKADEKF